jgi:hypothetical protein
MNTFRNHPHIYQINLMTWLNELSNREQQNITLATIPDKEWRILQAKGMDIVWLMGMWKRSPDSRKRAREEQSLVDECRNILPDFVIEDIAGSPYAIFDYYPDLTFGSIDDLRSLREILEDLGLFLVLDFVPNHTACDHPWIEQHSDFYVQNKTAGKRNCGEGFFRPGHDPAKPCIAHGKDPYFPPWTDTAQLNYSNEKCVQAVIETMLNISKYCHGIRCDMAMLLIKDVFNRTWAPYLQNRVCAQEFWPMAIKTVKSRNQRFLFLAEAYWGTEQELQDQGFDYTYDKTLYDLLVGLNIEGLKSHLLIPIERQQKLLRFLENHDESRALHTFGDERLRCAMVIHATLPGMRLWQQGQFQGSRIRTPVQLRRSPQEPVQKDVEAFFDLLLREVDHPVFHKGEWKICNTYGWADNQSHENLLAWFWSLKEERRLIVVNFSFSAAQGYVKLPSSWLSEGEQILFKDPLQRESFYRPLDQLKQSGLHIELKSGDFHFFKIDRA